MAKEVSNYVISALQDKSRVDKELLLTAMFLVEKWKKNLISGPDEKLKELLAKEDIDCGRFFMRILANCKRCPFSAILSLMKKLGGVPRKELITVTGGENRGNLCESFAYHGFNGLEKEVVGKIAEWILSK